MPRHFIALGLVSFGIITNLSSFACKGSEIATSPVNPATSPEKVYDITAYGAVRDGKTLNTQAIQSAIDKCAAGGGGTVLIPQGEFLSGAIFLKPGVHLHLDKGAVLQGSTNIADYPEMETRIEGHFQVWIPALVNAANVDHLRIDGEGMIQGGGKPFWDEFWSARAANKETKNLDVKRPRNIFIRDSKDVQISGISLRQSGFWNLHLYRCQNVLVEKMDIRTPLKAPSTDGIDVDSCQNVTIQGCYISVDDDNIALKGNKGTSALDDKTILPDENIHISDCEFGLGNAALTLGSEATTVRDVVMENCKLTGKDENAVIALKLRPDTEQDYENITVRNITVDNPSAKLIALAPWKQYFDLQGKPAPSQMVNGVTLSDIKGTLKNFGVISRSEKGTVQNVTFKNIDLTLKNAAVVVKGVKDIKFDNVTINGVPYTGQ
jgi:alpha-L-rhamnosidase